MSELEMDRVINLAYSYQEPRVLLTAVELGVFTIACGGPLYPDHVAEEYGWDAWALRSLLDALTVMGYLTKTLESYTVASCNRSLLDPDDDRGVVSAIYSAASAWKSWTNLTQRIVGNGRLPQIDSSKARASTLHAIDEKLAPGLAALVRPETGRRFLEVGGGSGAYTAAFLARDRALRATILDFPEMIEHTRGYLRAAGCEGLVELCEGEPTRMQWPEDQDLVLLSALIHDMSPSECDVIYGKAFRSLAAGGRVIIRDHIMSENRLRPRAGVFFNLHSLVCSAAGRTYTFAEIRRALSASGFVESRIIQDGERMNGIVEAYKPAAV
jgi:predicted O-methyltransferase YrrM